MYDMQFNICMGFGIYVIVGFIYAASIATDRALNSSSREDFTAGVLWPLMVPISLIKGLGIFWKILTK